MKRYLIVTHDYKRQSAGVRALHKLAHYLNQAGCEAYVTSEVRNPEWVTPLASPELQAEIARDGIVVYPEVEAGNKLNAVQVARFLLNEPGYIRGDKEFPASEQIFAYSDLLRCHLRNPRNLLTVPVVDLSIFNPFDRCERTMPCVFWVGKGKDVPRLRCTEDAVEITPEWPTDWTMLALLFRISALFISYCDYTMLLTEARLCGCPTLVVPSRYTREDLERAAPGGNGLAYSLDETDRAQRTVGQFWYDYQESVARFAVQLDRFIDITQRWQ